MKDYLACRLPRYFALLLLCCAASRANAQTRIIRVVSYNVMCDVGTFTTPLAGLITPFTGTGAYTTVSSGTVNDGGVLEGIGEEIRAGNYQPIDILGLQETTSNSATVQPIVNGLNSFYSSRGIAAGYAMSSLQLTSTSGGDGDGPNALVYNTNTLQLISSIALGNPSGSSLPRQVGRYLFGPAGVATNASNIFYVYVSHYKQGTNSSDLVRRGIEAGLIRTNSASLPANSRVLYIGDYNTSSSSEAPYQAIVGTTMIGIRGYDPFNPTAASGIDWTANSNLPAKTESARSLQYRDDFQIMSSNVYYGVSNGLALVAGTYHTFANSNSIAYTGSCLPFNHSLDSNLQPSPPISAQQIYTNLYGATDHMPVVADYTIPAPPLAPVASFTASPTNGAAPLFVAFTDTSTGNVTNWFWNFGDGNTANPTTNFTSHTYVTVGVYTVTLTVGNAGGSNTVQRSNLITAFDPFVWWQLQYFGCTNCAQALAGADPYGKGMSNTNQFLAGLNPTNPASLFAIRSVVADGSNNLVVTWSTAGPRTNAVQVTNGDAVGGYTNSFQDLSGATVTIGVTGDTTTNFVDVGAATNIPSRYYRIRLVP